MSMLALEWIAALFAVLGTILIALNGPRAGFGFVLYVVSNAAWLSFAWIQRDWAILAQNCAFLASSLLGIWVWLVRPRARTFRAVYRSARLYRGRLGSARVALRCMHV